MADSDDLFELENVDRDARLYLRPGSDCEYEVWVEHGMECLVVNFSAAELGDMARTILRAVKAPRELGCTFDSDGQITTVFHVPLK